jgi:hypothetical protein
VIPDIDLQLAVAIRALKGIVWDSVPTDNISARENLRASIATLEFVLARHSSQFARAAAELRNTLDLAKRVAAVTADTTAADNELDGAIVAAQSVMAQFTTNGAMTNGPRSLDAYRARLARAICDYVERARDPTVKRNITEAIVLASKSDLDLRRAWCLPAGFEADPRRVPTLEEVLGCTQERDSRAVEAERKLP